MANNDSLDFSQWAVKQPDVAANEPAVPDLSNQAVAPAAPAKTEVPQPKAPDFSDKAVTPAPVKDPAAPDWELAWEREARLNKAAEPESPKPSKKGPSSFTGIDAIIDNAARENGVDTNLLRTFAQIESGGRPSVQTGSYKGLFQLSNREFNNHGGSGDIFDPVANAQAGARKLKSESDQFKSQFGRAPTGPELYMIHQQGWGGAQQHWANPDQPAWQSMYSTAEGRQKGPRWAKQAIWGNVPDDVKRKFGSVDNMSSRDFTQMWADKYNRIGSRFGVMAENAPSQTGNSMMKDFMTAQPEQRQEILERKIEEIVGGEIPEFAAARRARQEQQRAADPATLDFSQFAVPDQKGATAPGQKTDAKKTVPEPAPTAFGLPKRDKLLPQEDAFFKSNPTMGAMAAEDGSVIVNPYAKMSGKEKEAVEFNEAARLYMKNNQFIPQYQLTPQQVAQFKGTPYEGDVKAMRETVAARVLAGDPSIKDATPEQKKFVDDYLRPFVGGDKDGFIGAITDPQQYLEGAKGIIPGAGRMAALGVQGVNALNPVRAVDLNSQKYVEDLRRVPSMSPKELSEFRQRVAKEPAPLTRNAVQSAISDILEPDEAGIGAKGWHKDVNAYVDARFGVTPMEETAPYKAGESIKKWVDDIEAFKPKAGYEKAILRQGGEGLGSMVGGLPFALLGPVPATVFFASAGSGEAIDRAVQWSKKEKEAGRPGLTEQQISSAGLMGIAPGATDIVPIETLMGRLPIPVPAPIRKALAAGVAKIGGKAFMEGLGRVSGQAAVEGGQEALQSFLQDVIAKTYDPNQVLGETILPEAGLGAGVGGFAQAAKEVGAGIIKSAANRRGGHASAPEPAPEEENLEKQKQIDGSEQKQIAGSGQKQADVPPSSKQIAQEIKLPDQRVKEPAKADTPAVGKTPSPREIELLKSQNWSDEDIADMGDEERADAVADAVAQGATSELADDEPTAEPIRDLKAQAEDLRNPDNGRAAVWLPKPSADALSRDKSASSEVLGSGVAIEDFDGKGGTLIARDEQAAQDAIARRDDGVPIQTIVGEMTGSGTGKLPNADTVVQQLTKDGAVARESAVPADQAEATAQSFAAPDRDVWVGTLSEALAKRDEAASADAVKVGRRDAPVNVVSPDDVAAASQRITEPSPKQAEAGNYAKGHVKFNGLDISIETPKGGTRRGYDEDGNPSWEVPDMPASYGYIKRSTGADGEQIDVYIGDNPKSDRVYLVDQVDADTGKFDEHKAILGTDSLEEAGNLYSRGFSDGRGPDRIGDITEMSVSEFKDWVRSGPQDAPYSDTLSSSSSQAEPAADDNGSALDFSDYAVPSSPVDAGGAEYESRSWGDRINEGRVVEALKGLEKRPNDWVSLSDLRGSLGNPDEQSWRNAMRDMLDSNDIALTINEDPRSITDQDRADSVRVGGTSMHFVRRMTDGEKAERGKPKDQISQEPSTKTVKPKSDLIEPPSRYDGDPLPDMEIDGIVDAWRYVQEMNRKSRPQSLTQFVIDNGGLVDDGGEIKHIAGGARERPGLINKNGQTLDDMALRAWQSGFLPGSGERPTISEFLDALDDDLLNGNIVREQDWEELENFKYADEAAQEIAEYGVNVSRFRSEASLREYFGQQRPRNSGATEADQEEVSTTKEREGGAGSAAVADEPAVTTEEDGQTSFVAPPTVKEKIDAASAKKNDKPEQKPMDEGLFGSDKDQLDLVDAAKMPVPAKNEKEPVDTKEESKPDEIEPASALPQPPVDGNALRDRIIKDGFKDIREARKFAKENGFKESSDKEIDEAIEQAVVDAAKLLTLDGKKTEREVYQGMVNLYDNQPNLGVRTSTSVANQAYSTPVPLAYLAARLAGTRTANVVYEPTAGNGALLIDVATPNNVFANELDPKRAAALKAQGYRTTTLDATEPAQAKAIRETKDGADSVIMNPPFGAVRDGGKSKSWDIDGFKTSTVDHAIAITALEAMADDGKAVLILGGVNAVDVVERRTGYRGQAKRQFFARLYRDYNVVDHFTVDGDLYRKQGAGWPVDVVVIDGRGKSAIPLPAANPPVILSSWSDLEGKLPNADAQANEGKARKDRRPAGSSVEAEPRPVSGDATGSGEATGGRPGGSNTDVKNEPVSVRGDGDRGKSGDVRPGEGSKVDVATGESAKPGRTNKPSPAPRGERVAPPEGSGQALYHPTSNAQSLESLVPSNMARATKDAVERIAKKHGGVDEYVAKALNYDVNSLSDYFSAEQIDAIAASIDNIGKGAAFIIGDQTGVGKGRVVAAMIRYAMIKKWTPLFVTEKPDLYGDMFRDMTDIGIDEMLGHEPRAFLTNTGASVPLDEKALQWKSDVDDWSSAREAESERLFDTDYNSLNAAQRAELKKTFNDPKPKQEGRFLKAGTNEKQLTDMHAIANGSSDYEMVFTTYDQMSTIKKQETERRNFIRQIVSNSLLILDESHNAGGQGQGGWAKSGEAMNRADFVRDLKDKAKGVLYSSATFAKRPDVMDLYARTDMGKAVDDPKKLPALIQRGGVPMQQIVATMLSDSGQYMRRERSFEGVEYGIDGVPVNDDTYSHLTSSVRSIFQFDRDVSDFRDAFMEEILDSIGSVKSKDSGVGEATAYSTNFASMMHNIINQMLLSVTSDQVADKAIQAVKNGEKPIIALSNTMESFVSDYADDAGVKIGGGIDITFGTLLKRYLDRTLRITVKTADDNKEHHQIPLKTLPSHLRKKYAEIEAAIEQGTYTMLPVSPIDWVRNRLSKAGISVAEVTGRSLMINYSGNKPTLAKRPKSEMGPTGKRASIAAFNRGSLDALILNRSGSTGVSMHASSKFKDQRRRRMIIQQADPNVDTHLQMLGRVHRTGQVIPPVYSQIAAEIPASVRPTAILMKKMASLNANTTGARGSAFMADATDFMNEVGDKIVANIIMDDPEINDALGNPLKEDNKGVPIDEDAARRVTGRLVLLDPKSQSELLDRIQEEYTAEITRLDALGENMLEAKTVDLQAKVLDETTVRDSQGEGPFLEAVKVQKVSAKAQGRAMAPDEIAAKIASGIDVAVPAGGVTNALQELERQGRQAMDKKAVDINKRVREWIASEVSKASGDAKASTRERHNKTLERWNELTSIAAPGARVVLDTDQGQMSGIVMTVERSGKTKNLSALGAWQVTIAVPDSVRSITFPMSKLFTANNPKGSEETGAFIDHSKVPTSGIMSQLEDARREGRETRYIVTGNILAGYEQVKGKGRIVNYTTEDGSLRPGILMGRDFELSKFMDTRSVRFKSADQVMTFLTLSPMAEVRSVDGFVTMSRNRGAWRISMPSSRATGGRYYTDKRVRDALGHLDFRRVSGVMSVELYDTGTFTKVVDAMRSIGAVFETTEDQSVAQETARIGVDNDASADAQASFSVGTMDRFEEVRAIIKSGQTYSVPAWHVADQMSAVRENLHLVPKDTHVGVLYEVEPLKDRTHDVDDPAVSLNYITPDGRKKTLTMGLNKSGIFRAFTLPRSALGGRPGIFLHNFEFGSNTSQAASGQVWHESVHVLRRDRLIAGDKWNRLLRHSNNLRILDMKMRDVARAVGDPKAENTDGALTVRQLYNYLYEGRGDERVELVRQESVTHMIELWHHGAISDEEMAPVKDILDEMGSGKLSGNRNKFSEIDEMFGAFAAEAPTVAPDIDSLGYYSGLLRAAYNLRQEKGTPEQMLSMLRKDGAKEAEVDASDLDLLFKGKTSVTKSQIIDHIRSAKTDISENVYSREDIRFTAINEELERHMAEWREEQEEDYEFDRDRSLYEYSVEELADKLRGFAEDNNLSVDEDLFDDNPIEALEKSGLVLVTGQIQATSEVERYVIATAGDKSALFSTNGAVSYGKNENELIDELESEIKYSMPIDETFEREQTQADLENEYNVDDHDPTKWSKYSLDPDNITYKETVLSIPAMHPELRVVQTGDNLWRVQNRITGEMIGGASYKNESQALGFLERRGSVSPQFRSQHFPQSNIVGHMLTSSVKHDGRGTYLLDQIQSDWGQKVRDGGLVDHKKVAVLKKTMQDAMSATRRQSVAIDQFVAENKEFVPDAVSMLREYHPSHGGSDFQALTSYGPLEIQPRANELADELKRLETEEERISAELWNAQQGVEVSHPLVNTTDQWVNTTLRRVIRQAVDSGAEFIAIPSGKTVEGYNPQGDSEGNAVFYDQIVPKNLRNLLRKIDKKSPDPIWVNKLKTPTSGMQGDGFKLFEITDKVKQSVVSSGQPMFAASPQAATLGKWMEWSENLGDKQFQISDRDGKSYTVNRVGRLGSITYMVKDGARPIGSFYVRTGGSVPGTISVMNAVMDQAYQRRGIASAIYDAIEADTAPGGRDLYPQGTFSLSPDGRAFWQARDPAKLEAMEKAESEPGYAYGQSIKVALDRPAQGRLKASISDAIEIVQRIAGSGVAIDFKSQMPASAARRAVDEMRPFRDVGRAGDVIGGFYRPKSAHLEALIGLSVEAPGFDLRTAAGHEAWHHVERVFATDDELNLLYSRAEQERMRNVAAVELGLDPRKPRDATLLAAMPPVEVTAWAFQRYRRLREEGLQDMSGLHIAVRRLFNRIYKILNNIKAAVKGEGLTYEKIFESARSGEMAKRAPRQGSSNQDPGVAAADAIKANAELMAQAIPGIENIIQSVVDRAANTNDDVATQAGLFVDQYIIVEDGQDVSDVDMYDAYKYWAKNANVDIIDADTFHRALISNGGLWRVKIGGRARYHGVRIATMVERKKADASALMAPEKRTLAQDIAQGASFSTALTRLIETMKAKVSGKTARQAAKEIADVNRLISIQDKIASSNDNDVDRTMADNVYSMFDSPDILAMAVASGPSGTRPMTWLERHTRRLFDRVSVRSDAIRVKIQDKALPIKRLAVERLEAETGTKVAASLDTYLREGLYSGRAGERMVDLEQDYVEPMIEHMRKAGISLEEAGDYVYARHARERNAWISLINPDLMDGGSGMTNAEADQILADVRASGKQADMDRAAQYVDDMIEKSRKDLLKSGLINRETFDAWSMKYASYVPLRGFELGEAENPDFPRVGRGYDVRGRESMQALGRRSKADNPIIYAVQQAQQAIVRAEKNRVNKTLYNAVQSYPNDGFWKVYVGEVRKRFNPSTGLVEEYFMPPDFVRRDDVIGVKLNGKQKWIEIKHPDLVRSIRGVGSDVSGTALGRAVHKVMRTYAGLLTSWNPEFVFSNFFRDMQTALINSTGLANKPVGIRRRIAKDALSTASIRGALAAIRNHEGRTIFGTHRAADETILGTKRSTTAETYAKYYDEFRLAGGKVSFIEFNDVERIRNKTLTALNSGRVRRGLRSAAEAIETLNTAVENGVRLSTYASLRDAGVSQDEAAFIAKELTVNFNRKGEWGPGINSMYLFFNASVQGIARMAMAIGTSKHVRYALGGIFAMGAMLDMLNYLVGGDDDDGKNRYDKIPEWIKERNIIIMNPWGDGNYMMIPMPYGYNAPFVAGREAMGVYRGASPAGPAASRVLLATIEAFNPLGSAGSFLQYASPTLLDPAVQIMENKTFFGGPIMPTKFKETKPDSQVYFDSAPSWAKWVARTLNSASGGDIGRPGQIDISPETFEHWAEFAGGGTAKFFFNAEATAERFVNGEEWLPEKTPMIRRLYGRQDSVVSRKREFYDAWREVEQTNDQIKTLITHGERDAANEARATHDADVKAYGAMKAARNQLKTLRKQRTMIENNETMDAADKKKRLDEIMEREKQAITRSLKVYEDAKKIQKD